MIVESQSIRYEIDNADALRIRCTPIGPIPRYLSRHYDLDVGLGYCYLSQDRDVDGWAGLRQMSTPRLGTPLRGVWADGQRLVTMPIVLIEDT